jgi:acyl carrier protein
MDTNDVIRSIISSIIHVDPASISDTTELGRELDIDSLSLLEIALKLEDRFGVVIPNSDYPELTSVSAIARKLDALSVGKQ